MDCKESCLRILDHFRQSLLREAVPQAVRLPPNRNSTRGRVSKRTIIDDHEHHETAQAGLERYLKKRRSYAPFDDHVFISLRRKPLRIHDAETAFQTSVDKIGLRITINSALNRAFKDRPEIFNNDSTLTSALLD
jgi:hypothetical protein